MQVSGINYAAIPSGKSTISFDMKFKTEDYSSTSKKAVAEQKQSVSSSIWDELSSQYNIRSATFDEMCEVANKLYEAGQLTFKEFAILTLDPSKSTQSVKPNRWVTSSDQYGRRDWIAEWEARVERDLEMGNSLNYENNQRILTVLSRLQSIDYGA